MYRKDFRPRCAWASRKRPHNGPLVTTMTVVLITQEIGSTGKEIASGIAVGLGLELIPQEYVVRLVATRMQAEESTLHRFIAGNASFFERLTIDRHRLAQYAAEELIKLAARDQLVIQSWYTPGALRPIRHVMCVRVCAATPRRMFGRYNFVRAPLSQPPSATAQGDDAVHHVVLNTAQASVPACAQRVMRLAQSSLYRRTSTSQEMLDSLLQERRVFDVADGTEPHVLDVQVGRERMRLFGITSNEQAIAQIEERLRGKSACIRSGGQRCAMPRELM
jgi:hypothetical protein